MITCYYYDTGLDKLYICSYPADKEARCSSERYGMFGGPGKQAGLLNRLFDLMAGSGITPVVLPVNECPYAHKEPLGDPLFLDLDGDGAKVGASMYFDFAGDGFREMTNMVSEGDGVLVMDLNGNGRVDSGAELFGNYTLVNGSPATDGYAALKQHDSNNDGVINSSDTNFSRLRLMRWTDADGDGHVDDGETRLETLSANGVSAINLAHETSDHVDAHGNEHRLVGSYLTSGGASRAVADVWLKVKSSQTEYDRSLIPAHSSVVRALTNIGGTGNVYDLRDAMELDDAGKLKPPFYGTSRTETRTLTQLVTAFNAATDSATRDDLAGKILHRWAGAEGAVAQDYWQGRSRLSHTTPEKLAVTEAFLGRKWFGDDTYRNPAHVTAVSVNRTYNYYFEHLRSSLLLAGAFKEAMRAITLKYKGAVVTDETDLGEADSTNFHVDFSAAVTLMSTKTATERSEFIRSLAVLNLLNPLFREGLKKTASAWLYEFDFHATHVHGMANTDGGLSTRHLGRDGPDAFRPTDPASERLTGGGGTDIYQLVKGTGHDVIHEDAGSDGTDIIMVAPDVARGDIRLRRVQDHLWVEILGSVSGDGSRSATDSFQVLDQYSAYGPRIEQVRFGDGTTYTLDDLAGVVLAKGGGTRGADRFDASFLPGALGETQRGGQGSDIYLLGRGTGHESIDEAHRNHAGSDGDVIRLKAGLALTDVRLTRHGADLKVGLVGSDGVLSDSLTIKGHYLGGARRVEFLESSDGTRLLDLLAAQSGVRLQNGNAGGVLEGLGRGTIDTFGIDAGSDTFRGRSGDDVYGLGLGSGADYVEEGHLNRVAGDSADTIRLGAGVTSSMARMRRTMWDLVVELVDSEGEVTDSLTVRDQYRNGWAKVEKVVLDDGSALWTSSDMDALSFTGPSYQVSSTTIRGAVSGENLVGSDTANDVFDSDAGGNDKLFGMRGDDEYRLGTGTGHDEVHEGAYPRGNRIRASSGDDAGDLIRVEAGHGTGDVRLRRDDRHLWVELLGTAGEDGSRPVTDSLMVVDYYERDEAKVETVEFADGTVWDSSDFHAVALRGGTGAENIVGRDDLDDIFDSDAGGNDKLFGMRGDDEYRLGTGTGHDEVREGAYLWGGRIRSGSYDDAGDLIRVEAGHGTGDVRLRRDDRHLWVELLVTAGEDGVRPVTDSLKVVDYFERDEAKVEAVEFADGTVWDSSDFHAVALRGGSGAEDIVGRDDLDDIFDSDAGGNDKLFGKGGDDEYRLGTGTGQDEVREGAYLWGGRIRSGSYDDAGDLIRVEAGHGTGDVRLRRDDRHLWVELLGAAGEDGSRPVTDSLMVVDYYERDEAKVETVEFADGTVWDSSDFHAVALRGGTGAENIVGRDDLDDIFDSDAGGNDKLFGMHGDDEYRLGTGTGQDEVREGAYLWGGRIRSGSYDDAGDLIRVEAGHGTGDVRLRRDDRHLWVELLGAAGEDGVRPVTDSLMVVDYYERDEAKVEAVEFADGTVWDSSDFHAVALRGGTGAENIVGRDDLDDIFDSDAGGNDKLFGKGGDDEYRLGTGTGFDEVHEGAYLWGGRIRFSSGDDAGDLIRVEAGHGIGDVCLRRDANHLLVELLGTAGEDGERPVTDSLKVIDYFARAGAKVETVEFADGTIWGGDFVVGTNQGDTVTSTAAWETLHGGEGDDTYVVSGEFGADRVVDSGGTDKVRVSGHASSTLSFSRDGEDMVMEVIGTHDRVTFDNWYAEGGSRKVERIEAGDKVLLSTAAERMATAMATFVSGGGTASDFVSRNHQDYWETLTGTPGS